MLKTFVMVAALGPVTAMALWAVLKQAMGNVRRR